MTKVNKKELINILNKKTNLDKDKCTVIINILERYFLLGKKNKESFINDLQNELNFNKEQAEKVYIISKDIIKEELKKKIINPFR